MRHADNGSRPSSATGRVKIALTGLGMVALMSALPASADPTGGHDAKVTTQTPPMLCEIGSDDATPGVGPNVVCQGTFVQAPPDNDQAFVTAAGEFSYRMANIGIGYEHPPFDTLVVGQTYQIQGWSIAAAVDGIRFTHDDTGHGMFVASDTTVSPF